MLTKEQLAEKLNGRKYGSEITPEEEKEAEASGLVVVFGYSDDNVELRGAINDELSAIRGCKIFIDTKGLAKNECDNDDCPFFKEYSGRCQVVIASPFEDDGWHFNTEIPHAKFTITEDGEKFCVGIVFSMADVYMKF